MKIRENHGALRIRTSAPAPGRTRQIWLQHSRSFQLTNETKRDTSYLLQERELKRLSQCSESAVPSYSLIHRESTNHATRYSPHRPTSVYTTNRLKIGGPAYIFKNDHDRRTSSYLLSHFIFSPNDAGEKKRLIFYLTFSVFIGVTVIPSSGIPAAVNERLKHQTRLPSYKSVYPRFPSAMKFVAIVGCCCWRRWRWRWRWQWWWAAFTEMTSV